MFQRPLWPEGLGPTDEEVISSACFNGLYGLRGWDPPRINNET